MDYKVYKPTKQEIDVLTKFAKINDCMYIEPDKICSILGTMDKNTGTLKSLDRIAAFELTTAHNFESKIGMYSINEFLGIIKTMDSYEIRIYETYLLIIDLDKKIKIQMFTIPEDAKLVPYTDVIGKFDRGYAKTDIIRFSMSWDMLKEVSKYQKILKSNGIWFYKKGDDLAIRISNEFTSTHSNMAEIEITDNKSDIVGDFFKNGGHTKMNFDLDILIEDTYEFTIMDKIVLMKGLEKNAKYLFTAQIK
jgi:hypothetical protein